MSSNLSFYERRLLEEVLHMGGGYVLDFRDRTFREFVQEAVGRNIDDPRYSANGSSKANRLRTFWRDEPPRVVGTLLLRLLDHAERTVPDCDGAKLVACRQIGARLSSAAPLEESLLTVHDDTTLQALSDSVHEALRADKPGFALDRLHAFTVRFLGRTCERNGLPVGRDETANGLLGKYCKHIATARPLQSEMSLRILKYSIHVFEAYNAVRNDQSPAHPNPVLNAREALLVCNYVILMLNFLDSIESEHWRKSQTSTGVGPPDDIPF